MIFWLIPYPKMNYFNMCQRILLLHIKKVCWIARKHLPSMAWGIRTMMLKLIYFEIFINNYFSNILRCNTTILKLSPFNSFTLSPLKKLLIKSTVKLLPPVSMEPLKVLVLSFLHSNLKKLDKFIKKLKSQNTS